jgi:hypothetical protein
MLKQACIAAAIGALVFGFGGQPGQAGWSDAGSSLTAGASSALMSVKKNKNQDDDDDDDDHHNGKGNKKKNADDGAALSECTIQGGNSGGGCKNGKWTCEKMKSGKKCCGCVPDPKAGSAQQDPQAGEADTMGWKYLNLDKEP